MQDTPGVEIGEARARLRYKVSRALGFACPDIDDVVQETLRRFLESGQRIRDPEAVGAFLNGICRNVILEYRRRMFRDSTVTELAPDHPDKSITQTELFELRDAIEEGMGELSARDRRVLQMFYLEEAAVDQILAATGLSEPTFRVVLFRAKERFRRIYRNRCNKPATSGTS